MSTEMFTSLKDFFSAVWEFFKLQVPGFNFSFGALALALLLIDFSLRIVSFICGFGFGGLSGIGSFIHGASHEFGGNNKKVTKIDSNDNSSSVWSSYLD